MAANHLLKSSWTRLVSTLVSPRYHFLTVTHSYRAYCSAPPENKSSNSELGELWGSKEGLVRCSANHVPLSPIGFLERAVKAYRDRTSVIYGSRIYTWAQTHQRCLKLASALTHLGISRGDVVSNPGSATGVLDSIILSWLPKDLPHAHQDDLYNTQTQFLVSHQNPYQTDTGLPHHEPETQLSPQNG